jgi:tRNA threonylcarbamoyl adenosine modification protein YjeE
MQAEKGSIEISTDSPEQSEQVGIAIADIIKKGDLVFVSGDLGSGKSVVIRGILRGLGLPEKIAVRSPTFTIVNEYETKFRVRHADLYRLETLEEIDGAGLFDEASFEYVTLVEWGERCAKSVAPDITLTLHQTGETSRDLKITCDTDRLNKLDFSDL